MKTANERRKEAETTLGAEAVAILKQIEEALDAAGPNKNRIIFDGPSNPQVIRALINLGYGASSHYDQRDGHYYEIVW
jgi:hypothetical protein